MKVVVPFGEPSSLVSGATYLRKPPLQSFAAFEICSLSPLRACSEFILCPVHRRLGRQDAVPCTNGRPVVSSKSGQGR